MLKYEWIYGTVFKNAIAKVGVSMSGIILFDGYCNFCSETVQFIIKRDPNKYFQFASLQSDIGQILLRKHDLESAIDSFVLIEDEKM